MNSSNSESISLLFENRHLNKPDLFESICIYITISSLHFKLNKDFDYFISISFKEIENESDNNGNNKYILVI